MAVYENISIKDFNKVIRLWQKYIANNTEYNYVQVAPPLIPTILSACEDSTNMVTYGVPTEYSTIDENMFRHFVCTNIEDLTNKIEFPLDQTTQMYMEWLIRTDLEFKLGKYHGMYCIAPSFRHEDYRKIIDGRHLAKFLLLDFEAIAGTRIDEAYAKLVSTLLDIIKAFGFGTKVRMMSARDINPNGPVTSIDEARLAQDGDYTPVLITNFRGIDEPYWNMQHINYTGDTVTDTFYKIDVLLPVEMPTGQIVMMEVIGSAVRSNDSKVMRERFYNIQGGQYAQNLIDKFGEKRVEYELKQYFKVLEENPMITLGGGIGINRLIKALNFLEKYVQNNNSR